MADENFGGFFFTFSLSVPVTQHKSNSRTHSRNQLRPRLLSPMYSFSACIGDKSTAKQTSSFQFISKFSFAFMGQFNYWQLRLIFDVSLQPSWLVFFKFFSLLVAFVPIQREGINRFTYVSPEPYAQRTTTKMPPKSDAASKKIPTHDEFIAMSLCSKKNVTVQPKWVTNSHWKILKIVTKGMKDDRIVNVVATTFEVWKRLGGKDTCKQKVFNEEQLRIIVDRSYGSQLLVQKLTGLLLYPQQWTDANTIFKCLSAKHEKNLDEVLDSILKAFAFQCDQLSAPEFPNDENKWVAIHLYEDSPEKAVEAVSAFIGTLNATFQERAWTIVYKHVFEFAHAKAIAKAFQGSIPNWVHDATKASTEPQWQACKDLSDGVLARDIFEAFTGLFLSGEQWSFWCNLTAWNEALAFLTAFAVTFNDSAPSTAAVPPPLLKKYKDWLQIHALPSNGISDTIVTNVTKICENISSMAKVHGYASVSAEEQHSGALGLTQEFQRCTKNDASFFAEVTQSFMDLEIHFKEIFLHIMKSAQMHGYEFCRSEQFTLRRTVLRKLCEKTVVKLDLQQFVMFEDCLKYVFAEDRKKVPTKHNPTNSERCRIRRQLMLLYLVGPPTHEITVYLEKCRQWRISCEPSPKSNVTVQSPFEQLSKLPKFASCIGLDRFMRESFLNEHSDKNRLAVAKMKAVLEQLKTVDMNQIIKINSMKAIAKQKKYANQPISSDYDVMFWKSVFKGLWQGRKVNELNLYYHINGTRDADDKKDDHNDSVHRLCPPIWHDYCAQCGWRYKAAGYINGMAAAHVWDPNGRAILIRTCASCNVSHGWFTLNKWLPELAPNHKNRRGFPVTTLAFIDEHGQQQVRACKIYADPLKNPLDSSSLEKCSTTIPRIF